MMITIMIYRQTHVAADGVADGHVTVALLDHGDPGEAVGHADQSEVSMWSRDLSSTNPSSPDPGGDECEAHDGVRDAEGEPDHGDHPDHHVAVQADPHHRDQERHHEP